MDEWTGAGRPDTPVPSGSTVEASQPPDSPRPLGKVTSPWLARREGETPQEQMERIRRTCRWCGLEYSRLFLANLRRHEMDHIKTETADDDPEVVGQ